MQKRANKTRNKSPKTYSQLSPRGHREYRVPMTFLVSISIKLKYRHVPDVIEKKKKKRFFQ